LALGAVGVLEEMRGAIGVDLFEGVVVGCAWVESDDEFSGEGDVGVDGVLGVAAGVEHVEVGVHERDVFGGEVGELGGG